MIFNKFVKVSKQRAGLQNFKSQNESTKTLGDI